MFLVHFFSGGEVTAGGVFALSAILLIISAAIYTLLFLGDFGINSFISWNVVLSSMYTFCGLAFDGCCGIGGAKQFVFYEIQRGGLQLIGQRNQVNA